MTETGEPPVAQEQQTSGFFEAVCEAWEEAGRRHGVVERFFQIGGHTLCLCFAGEALVPLLTPALEHLEVPPSLAALTVRVWDSASTGVAMPPPVWSASDMLPRGEVSGWNEGPVRLTYHPDPDTVSLMHEDKALAVFWIADAALTPYYESGAPVRSILHWWMSRQSLQLVHAAALGMPTGGVVLAGRGGSGKSTTALACLNSDLFYAGDDYCIVSAGSAPVVHSLYNTAKANGDDVARFPHLVHAVTNTDKLAEEKALLFLHRAAPHKLIAGFPLRAILAPRVTGERETRVVPVTATEALRALAPSTIFQLPGAGGDTLRLLAGVSSAVPCYRLELGTDLAAIPTVITKLLS